MTPKYKRILLKLSGEVLLNRSTAQCIDSNVVKMMAEKIKAVREMGVDVAIVLGGGNIFRGAIGEELGIGRSAGDYMGMLATVINGIALQNALEGLGIPTRVQTAIAMHEVAEPYLHRKAMRHLEKGRVVIFAAGTGNPYFSTDTAAALRASEIGADVLMKPAAPGTGIIAGGTVRSIIGLTGVKNLISKSLGSTNKVNIAYAVIEGLRQQVPRKEWTGVKTEKAEAKAEKPAAKKPAAKKSAKKEDK